MAAKLALPVVKNTCPMDGHSRRQEVKELLAELEQRYPDLKKKLFGAVQRRPQTAKPEKIWRKWRSERLL